MFDVYFLNAIYECVQRNLAWILNTLVQSSTDRQFLKPKILPLPTITQPNIPDALLVSNLQLVLDTKFKNEPTRLPRKNVRENAGASKAAVASEFFHCAGLTSLSNKNFRRINFALSDRYNERVTHVCLTLKAHHYLMIYLNQNLKVKPTHPK